MYKRQPLAFARGNLHLHDDRDDHRSGAVVVPDVVGERVAHGLANGVGAGAREVELALLDGALNGGGGISGELVVDRERDATTGKLEIADLLALQSNLK